MINKTKPNFSLEQPIKIENQLLNEGCDKNRKLEQKYDSKNSNFALLTNRRLIEVKGADGTLFLQNLITTNINDLTSGIMKAGALLSPQGKVLFDFLIGRGEENRYFIDVSDTVSDILVRRLSLYKLRADVEIILHAPMQLAMRAITENCDFPKNQSQIIQETEFYFLDNRFPPEEKIMRFYRSVTEPALMIEKRKIWDKIRIENAIAESGTDFTLGDVFPHDINFDQIGGLSFSKGCYIGQEVISRMHHRGTARRRLLLVKAQQALPASGTSIEADNKPIGVMGSSLAGEKSYQGLAIIRLDRAKSALDKGLSIYAGNAEIQLEIPSYAKFSYPSIAAKDV